ncbi:hypothetical protein Clacol_004331 [Clathrus columnatus]|uniref:Uncharacterized protein n=1 Tax=Clathrus columnatus TaxID=1419009 RepID=A0AAV5ADV3_9AGAM|nr:hypothetical protein Clacol_004331 [Clathrus columnatus]
MNNETIQTIPVEEVTFLQTSVCDNLNFSINAIAVLPRIGVQGLIALRTYALCQGYQPMTIALFIAYSAGLAIQIYGLNPYLPALNLIGNLSIVLTDALAFSTVIRQTWGLWKEKRRLQLQTNADFVTLLLQQGVLRFSFVLLVTPTAFIISYFSHAVTYLIFW